MSSYSAEYLASTMRSILERFSQDAINPYFRSADKWELYLVPYLVMGDSLGKCAVESNKIYMNEEFVAKAPNNKVMDVVQHECAHALAGIEYSYSNDNEKARLIAHGKVWKKYARMIGACDKATTSREELGDYAKFLDSLECHKWIIVLDDGKSITEVSRCKRKLKDLAHRYYDDVPNSYGNLWLVEGKYWHLNKNNTHDIRRNLFR